MCRPAHIIWHCGCDWVGLMPCAEPNTACREQDLIRWRKGLPRGFRERLSDIGLHLRLIWCCSPKCCNIHISERMASVDQIKYHLELDSTQADAKLKSSAEEQYRGRRSQYWLVLSRHTQFCVNCFVDGLGRSRSMCEDMDVEFVPDEVLKEDIRYMTTPRQVDHPTSSNKMLLSFYERVIRQGGGIQGVDSLSIVHFSAIKGYLERVGGMCEDGWPRKGKKREEVGPESWRLLYNQTTQQTQ